MSYPYPKRADIGRTLLPAPAEPEPEVDPDEQAEMAAFVDAFDRQHEPSVERDLFAEFVFRAAEQCVNAEPLVFAGPVEHGYCDCCWEAVPLDELHDGIAAGGTETTACERCWRADYYSAPFEAMSCMQCGDATAKREGLLCTPCALQDVEANDEHERDHAPGRV